MPRHLGLPWSVPARPVPTLRIGQPCESPMTTAPDPEAPLLLVAVTDPWTRTKVRRALKTAGYHLAEAASAAGVLAFLQQARPALVLLDCALPDLDGFQTCGQLRRLTEFPDLPILLLTERADLRGAQRAFDVGSTDSMVKPISGRQLCFRVKTLLHLQQAVTDLQTAQSRIRQLRRTDHLTALANSSRFRAHLSRALASTHTNATLTLLYLDLDRFKRINDTLGHLTGDRVLIQIAQRIQGALAAAIAEGLLPCALEECCCARFGGDEFAVMLPGIDPQYVARQLAQKLLACLTQPFAVDGYEVVMTASLGISHFPGDTRDPDTLLKNAATAAYHAKQQGGNNFQNFQPILLGGTAGRLRLENELRKALENGELSLYLQPQIELANNRLFGVETLLRWHHRRLGTLLPGSFLPIAMESGLIGDIDEWALRQACRQLADWQKAGWGDLHLSVNLSGQLYWQSRCLESLLGIIHSSGADPSRLEVELTENTLMHKDRVTLDFLSHFKALGVQIAIDDFGTGFSSLGYLKDFPVDTLKIDRSFIRGLNAEGESCPIVEAILAMGKSLGLRVVCEGIENKLQLTVLKEMGCPFGQGFYLGRPMPETLFTRQWRLHKASV